MDYKSIFKLLSIIGMVLAASFLSTMAIGWIEGEDLTPFVAFNLLFFLLNAMIYLPTRDYPINLGIKESILLVNLLWALLMVAGAIPLMLYSHANFADAIFEATSGFTTTGSTIFEHIEALPLMILYHRSLMHWLGGMGIIVLGIGLLSMINPSGSLSLFKAESTGIQMEKLTPKIKDTALRLWGIYLVLTVADMIMLMLFGMDWFNALNHAFSTVSTGGFSTKDASLGYYAHSDGIIWTTTLFMVLAGINFLVHLRLAHKDTSGYRSEEVRWYLSIIVLISLVMAITHTVMSSDSLYFSIEHSFFTIVSLMTTTGFASLDYEGWGSIAVAICFVAMFVGGNAGSTSGGVKVIRYVIMFKVLSAELKSIIHPNALNAVFLDGNRVKKRILTSTFGFFFLFILTTIVVALYVYARGFDALTAVSASLGIVGNIGPGFSLVGPAHNYALFGDIDKIFLSIAMIVGRLECYTFFVLFHMSFWKKF